MANWPRLATIVLGSLLLGGCSTPKPVVPGDVETGRETTIALGTPQAVHLVGLIELHWSDEDGRHLEQGDLEVWLDGNDRVSARVTKFGDVYVWTGTTPEGSFTFDLTSDPTVLTTASGGASQATPLHPRSLRRLLGIGGLPPEAQFHSRDDQVEIVSPLEGGRVERILLDATGRQVQRISIESGEEVEVAATHRGHEDALTLVGLPFARYVDIRSGDSLARVRIARIEAPDQVPAAVFDLERLRAALRPDVTKVDPEP
ncbi:MAG: hypothetical protein MK101_07440 [Phycisphaerales bacterium]|nr:hypothetical protein [Phycisphaerales bacterium]